MSARRWIYAAAVVGVVAIGFVAYQYYVRSPKLTLTIEVTGGFAYVSPNAGDNHLNIAYLNSWKLMEDINNDGIDDEACNVPQVGTEMKLIVGDIVDHEPKAKQLPQSREFNLDKAIVRFPAVAAANLPLTMVRDKFTEPPFEPADPDKPADWKKNLKWIPSIKEYHSGNVSNTTIRPDWPNVVNGRMELRGGEIVASTPTNPKFKKARFDFRQGVTSRHKVSTTDKSIYTVRIPISSLTDGNLEITLSNATSGFTKLVIKPQGNKVELQLTGLHNMGAPDLKDGDPLTDFCTFYQLLQPRPAAKDFLVPYYMKAAATVSTAPNSNAPPGFGQPSPGFYCVGDWF